MDFTEYTSIKNKFTRTPNLCDLFKLLSIETWKRIEYAYLNTGVKVFETTLTQNLLFSINAYNDQYKLNIDIFEAKDERTNGNDFELIIKYPSEGVEYYAPIQAKKIYRRGIYTSMDHGVQIESLLDYGKKRDSSPLYLLYNYSPSPLRKERLFPNPYELSGCSMIDAEHLYNHYYNKRTITKKDGSKSLAWKIPNFYGLNPSPSFAWHELVCPSDPVSLFKNLSEKSMRSFEPALNKSDLLISNEKTKLGFHRINTFSVGNDWTNIKNLTALPPSQETGLVVSNKDLYNITDYSVKNSTPNQKIENEITYPDFAPRARIVLTKDSKNTLL